MFSKLGSNLRRNGVAYVALFLVLTSGSALALKGQNTVFSDDIVNGEVRTKDIHKGAVTAAKLAPQPAWRLVGGGTTTEDQCTLGRVARFCSFDTAAGPTNLSPWSNVGQPYATAGFFKDSLGFVHLRGMIKNYYSYAYGGDDQTLFILPAGFRPARRLVLSTVGSDEGVNTAGFDVARIDVLPNGRVQLVSSCTAAGCTAKGSGYLSLDGIEFPPN